MTSVFVCASHLLLVYLCLPFLTSVSTVSSLDFLVVGDAGKDLGIQQDEVDNDNALRINVEGLKMIAKQMDVTAAQNNASFILAVGDNFYEEGIRSVSDSRWNTTFEFVFDGDALGKIPYYALLGNHDYYGNRLGRDDLGTRAQIDFTTAETNINKRWNMPDYYYDFVKQVDDFTIHVVVVDVYSMMEYGERGCFDGKLGNKRPHHCPKSGIPSKDQQMAWIEKTLQESQSDWLFVAGHFPICSVGTHGAKDNFTTITEDLRKLLIKHKVDAYFAGHDHISQVLSTGEGNISLALYGIGSSAKRGMIALTQERIDAIRGPNVCQIKHASSERAFSRHSITKNEMTSTIIDQTGNILYEERIKRRRFVK